MEYNAQSRVIHPSNAPPCLVLGVFSKRKLSDAAKNSRQSQQRLPHQHPLKKGIWMANQTRHSCYTMFPAHFVRAYY